MLKKFRQLILKNHQIFSLIILIFITAILTSYFNATKHSNDKAYYDLIDNIYLKKTLNHFVKNLEPK